MRRPEPGEIINCRYLSRQAIDLMKRLRDDGVVELDIFTAIGSGSLAEYHYMIVKGLVRLSNRRSNGLRDVYFTYKGLQMYHEWLEQ